MKSGREKGSIETLLDLSHAQDAFIFEEGFSRPDWSVLERLVAQRIRPQDLDEAWCHVASHWLQRLRDDLGGNYRIDSSRRFLLLSAVEPAKAEETLSRAEAILNRIELSLGESAYKIPYGRDVLLLFGEADDYYQYVSYFYEQGVHPTSGGCLLTKDYLHIAIPGEAHDDLRRVLAHELTHLCLHWLDLPTWLNEGLAQHFERISGAPGHAILDHDLRERHFAFWQEDNIQEFWAGTSFQVPGESNELSYSLAEILVELLLANKEHFPAFVRQAKSTDAGQTAALDCLGMDLDAVAGTFLGEGNWRPVRKALVLAWEAYDKAHPEEGKDRETL